MRCYFCLCENLLGSGNCTVDYQSKKITGESGNLAFVIRLTNLGDNFPLTDHHRIHGRSNRKNMMQGGFRFIDHCIFYCKFNFYLVPALVEFLEKESEK